MALLEGVIGPGPVFMGNVDTGIIKKGAPKGRPI